MFGSTGEAHRKSSVSSRARFPILGRAARADYCTNHRHARRESFSESLSRGPHERGEKRGLRAETRSPGERVRAQRGRSSCPAAVPSPFPLQEVARTRLRSTESGACRSLSGHHQARTSRSTFRWRAFSPPCRRSALSSRPHLAAGRIPAIDISTKPYPPAAHCKYQTSKIKMAESPPAIASVISGFCSVILIFAF